MQTTNPENQDVFNQSNKQMIFKGLNILVLAQSNRGNYSFTMQIDILKMALDKAPRT